jgi:ParB-like chromosome segregation protein Spo0J
MPKKKPAHDFPYILESLGNLAVPLDDLTPDPRNARTHSERNIKAICQSLSTYGARKPIVVQLAGDGRKIIRAGNGTAQAARRLGWTHLPALFVQEDDQAATGFALAANRTAELAEWDQSLLAELLQQADNPELTAMCADITAAGDEVLQTLEDAQPAAAADSPAPPVAVFRLLVSCENEQQQIELLDRLHHQGLDVKALIA